MGIGRNRTDRIGIDTVDQDRSKQEHGNALSPHPRPLPEGGVKKGRLYPQPSYKEARERALTPPPAPPRGRGEALLLVALDYLGDGCATGDGLVGVSL